MVIIFKHRARAGWEGPGLHRVTSSVKRTRKPSTSSYCSSDVWLLLPQASQRRFFQILLKTNLYSTGSLKKNPPNNFTVNAASHFLRCPSPLHAPFSVLGKFDTQVWCIKNTSMGFAKTMRLLTEKFRPLRRMDVLHILCAALHKPLSQLAPDNYRVAVSLRGYSLLSSNCAVGHVSGALCRTGIHVEQKLKQDSCPSRRFFQFCTTEPEECLLWQNFPANIDLWSAPKYV